QVTLSGDFFVGDLLALKKIESLARLYYLNLTDGFSGAEIVSICQEAALCAMDDNLEAKEVRLEHFIRALSSFTRRITPEMIQFYDKFRQKS
ncbi:6851_t:CDS:2, partial [Cetraspora pellucida]